MVERSDRTSVFGIVTAGYLPPVWAPALPTARVTPIPSSAACLVRIVFPCVNVRHPRGAPHDTRFFAAVHSDMRILYIGGTGEISFACVHESVRLGHEVSVFNRGNHNAG